jgi:hypothetical protein|nr:MAG TPA: minor capsid protein [Caudoviricetes sp.]
MTTSLKQSKAYWDNRAKAEKAWQESAKKDMEKYNQHIVSMYNQTISDINQQIKADLALSEGKLVKADAMKEYESLAKRAVDKANALRAKGKHVTRKDFSEDVNNRLKVYNATMRINRNEIIKSKIGARLVELGVDQEQSLTNKLWNEYTKEKERQAGILGITTKSNLWTSKEVQEQIAGQIAGANFSKRIWADIDGLKGQLDGLVSNAVIRGESPIKTAKWLTGLVSASITNQEYAAERLARTEMARVQFEAQKRSIIDTGYKYVKWIAEGSACKVCREIAYKDNGYDEDGVYKAKDVPDIPVHPNCMCSISAHWVDDSVLNDTIKNNDFDNITSYDDFDNKIKSNFGVNTITGMKNVSVENLNKIYQSLSNNFNQYPALKGKLDYIKGYQKKRDKAVASWNVEGDGSNGFKFNKAQLDDFDKNLKYCIEQNWWTYRKDYTGVINHEFAHFIEGMHHHLETGEPFSLYDLSNNYGFEMIKKAFKEAGIPLKSRDQFADFTSKYGLTNQHEMFAEMMADEKGNAVTKELHKLINSDEVYKK